VANTCELLSGGIPGYDGAQPAAAFARVRTAGKGGHGGHGGKDGGDGSDDRDQSEDDDTPEGAGDSQGDDDSQEGGSDDGSQEDGDSEGEASDGPSHDDEVGVLVLPVIASYLATCTAPNTDYSAIVSVSQVHITTPVLIVGTCSHFRLLGGSAGDPVV
jgi:hypothetical protein